MVCVSRFVLRHRLLVAVGWLVLTVAGGVATLGVSDRLTGQLAQPGQPAYEANQKIIQEYRGGGDNPPLIPVVTLPAGLTVDSPGAGDQLTGVCAALAERVHARVVCYPQTGDDRMVAADRRSTFGLVYPPAGGRGSAGRAATQVEAVLADRLPAGWRVELTGMAPLESGGGGGGLDVLAETLIGGVGALTVLAVVFGSLLATVPLLIAGVSVLTSFLAVAVIAEATPVSQIVQFVVALIGLGVAIDYSLLLVTRWREELAAGRPGPEAVTRAMATAGRAVLLSATSVAIGLVAMVVLPVPFLRSIGYGGMVIPMVSALVVLTLLPVLLVTVGERLDRIGFGRRTGTAASPMWTAWAGWTVRWRWPVLLCCAGLLGALGLAATGIRLGGPDSGSLADGGPAYRGRAALIAITGGTGALTPVEVYVPAGTDPTVVAGILAGVPGVGTVLAPADPGWRHGSAVVDVLPVAEGGTDAGRATVERIRAAAPPGVLVGGSTAQSVDFVDSVYGTFPAMLCLISLITFVVLVRALRSVLLAVKAIALNLASVAATVGAVVLVWQQGYGSWLWGVRATGSITEFIPVMIFAFLYGLSMDYEVFILARVRESYDATGSTRAAIVAGIGRTGRLVTSAALILFLAFASLASAPNTELKVFATGLGIGILLDATLVRGALVPALLAVAGRWNWWLPGWLTWNGASAAARTGAGH